MSNLPARWVKTTFGEVTEIVGGGTPSSKDASNFTTEGGRPWITPSDLSGYKEIYIKRGARNLTEKGLRESSAKVFPAGSVLFSSRAPIGYVAIAANEVSTNQGFKSFILPDGLDSKYIYFYLRNIKPVAEMMATGTTFKELSGSNAARLPLILPPLNEQKRIAEKLDSLFARVDSCKSHLERVPQILKRFRQSVLAAATSGRLTEDWREEHRVNGEWESCALGDVLTDIKYGTSKKSVYDLKNGISVLRIPNIKDGKIDAIDLKFSHFDEKEIKSLALKTGDLLFIRSNGSVDLVGKVAIVDSKYEGFMYAGYLIRLRFDTTKVNPLYISFYLSSPAIRSYIELTARSTSGVNNINSEEVKAIFLELPSLEEQAEIVRRVEKLFGYVERLVARYTSASEHVERLTPSLLAKAFRGELVEQDDGDESAAELVKRIRALQATSQSETKNTKSPRKKKDQTKNEAAMLKISEIQPNHLSSILQGRSAMTAEALWAASQLEIDDFYDQLKDEESRGWLREIRREDENSAPLLEAL